MVRLKEKKNMSNKEIFELISIPYGAIKRCRVARLKCIFLDISIPYGAIKRIFYTISKIFANLFQFLMVRLKV